MSILAMAGHMLITCLGLLMVFLLVTLMLGLRSRVLSFNKGQIIGMMVTDAGECLVRQGLMEICCTKAF